MVGYVIGWDTTSSHFMKANNKIISFRNYFYVIIWTSLVVWSKIYLEHFDFFQEFDRSAQY